MGRQSRGVGWEGHLAERVWMILSRSVSCSGPEPERPGSSRVRCDGRAVCFRTLSAGQCLGSGAGAEPPSMRRGTSLMVPQAPPTRQGPGQRRPGAPSLSSCPSRDQDPGGVLGHRARSPEPLRRPAPLSVPRPGVWPPGRGLPSTPVCTACSLLQNPVPRSVPPRSGSPSTPGPDRGRCPGVNERHPLPPRGRDWLRGRGSVNKRA